MMLTDHTILITGAAGGLGGVAALALAKQGATLILLDKSIPKLEKIYDAIVEQGGPEPVMYPFDLAGANEQEYQDLADAVAGRYGSLQGLLHSAVEFSAYAPISQYKTKDWGQALNVNLNAPFLLTKVLLPLLQDSPQQAAIVFTADTAVRTPNAYHGAYGVSKIAVEALANILAAELSASGKIRVNTLLPGLVDAPLRKRAYPAEDKSRLAPMSSLQQVYVYLFSAASRDISGQTIDAQTFNV